jgi:hypothetical protein
MSKYLTLLGVELFEITNTYIHELREKNPNDNRVFDHLPEYTFNRNTDTGLICLAREHHQFVGSIKPDKEEKYLYFNLHTSDSILDYEISEGGMEYIFEGINLEKFLDVFKPHTVEDHMKHVMPHTHYLIISIEFNTYTDYEGGSETEVYYDIEGYLDHNLQRQSFEPEPYTEQEYPNGSRVKLPFNEEGEILRYQDLPWGSRYWVKVTKSNLFNKVGDEIDVFEKDLELIED